MSGDVAMYELAVLSPSRAGLESGEDSGDDEDDE